MTLKLVSLQDIEIEESEKMNFSKISKCMNYIEKYLKDRRLIDPYDNNKRINGVYADWKDPVLEVKDGKYEIIDGRYKIMAMNYLEHDLIKVDIKNG